MAKRPIFLPTISFPFFRKVEIDFNWHPGFSLVQKQKSLVSLHRAAKEYLGEITFLEVSSKSPNKLGHQLSAFNLAAFTTDLFYNNRGTFSLETVFQTSKVFKPKLRCTDLLGLDELEIRNKIRQRQIHELSHFELENEKWSLEPAGAFYNYLYIRSLYRHQKHCYSLEKYEGFTDIEFNPIKSFNCQAESVSQFLGMKRSGIDLEDALSSQNNFLKTVYPNRSAQASETLNFLDQLE
jgi:hypothetical protein